jgi:hypothetical protein
VDNQNGWSWSSLQPSLTLVSGMKGFSVVRWKRKEYTNFAKKKKKIKEKNNFQLSFPRVVFHGTITWFITCIRNKTHNYNYDQNCWILEAEGKEQPRERKKNTQYLTIHDDVQTVFHRKGLACPFEHRWRNQIWELTR